MHTRTDPILPYQHKEFTTGGSSYFSQEVLIFSLNMYGCSLFLSKVFFNSLSFLSLALQGRFTFSLCLSGFRRTTLRLIPGCKRKVCIVSLLRFAKDGWSLYHTVHGRIVFSPPSCTRTSRLLSPYYHKDDTSALSLAVPGSSPSPSFVVQYKVVAFIPYVAVQRQVVFSFHTL